MVYIIQQKWWETLKMTIKCPFIIVVFCTDYYYVMVSPI